MENVLKSGLNQSQKHQNKILCFISTKFTIIYSLVRTGQLSIILDFDVFENKFMYKPNSKTFSSMTILGLGKLFAKEN